jgi:hypothetical protein
MIKGSAVSGDCRRDYARGLSWDQIDGAGAMRYRVARLIHLQQTVIRRVNWQDDERCYQHFPGRLMVPGLSDSLHSENWE